MANDKVIELLILTDSISTTMVDIQGTVRHIDSNPMDKKRLDGLVASLNTSVKKLTDKVQSFEPQSFDEEIKQAPPVTPPDENYINPKNVETTPTPGSVGNTIQHIEPEEFIEDDPTMELPEIEEEPVIERKQPKKTFNDLNKFNRNRKQNRGVNRNVKNRQRIKKDSK